MNFTKTRSARKSRTLTRTRKASKSIKNDQYFKIAAGNGDEFLLKEYFIYDVKIIKIYYGNEIPCVEIHIMDDEDTAILETVSYNEKCSMKGLQSKSGTKYMCQVTLKYVMDKYPWIKKIQIADNSAYTIKGPSNNNTSLITGRYLLQGRPGLYQEYCDAYPINQTPKIIETIKKYRNKLDERIAKYMLSNDDWTPLNIQKYIVIGLPINYSMQTEWEVNREIVNKYQVNYRLYKNQSGGGGHGINFDKIYANYLPYFTQFIDKKIVY